MSENIPPLDANESDKPEKRNFPEKVKNISIDTITAIVSLVSGILITTGLFILPLSKSSQVKPVELPSAARYKQSRAEQDSLIRESEKQIEESRKLLDELDSTARATDRTNDSLLVLLRPSNYKIIGLLTDLDSRLTRLERVIIDNPEKAVALPLLKRDIENLKASHDARLESLNDSLSISIDRLYTVIGTVTVVIGVGLVAALYATISAKKQEQIQAKPRKQ